MTQHDNLELRKSPITLPEIRAFVGRDDALVVEIGANNGDSSRAFLGTFPRGRIYCFEPDERCIRKWRANVTDPRATLIESAVGEHDGTVAFHLSDGRESEGHPEGWDYSGSILEPSEELFKRWPWLRFERTREVSCISLDTWARQQEIGEIDFIWADVQGAEAQLILGARECLARTRYFYTEYGPASYYKGQPSLDMLRGMLPDFDVVAVWSDDVLFARRI